MGLDQYIFREIPNEFEKDGRSSVEEVYYWRKNYELNDWACNNFCPDYISDFNCERLRLTRFMVDKLIKYILFNADKSDLDANGYQGIVSKDILESFNDCKKRIDEGEVVYYLAWW